MGTSSSAGTVVVSVELFVVGDVVADPGSDVGAVVVVQVNILNVQAGADVVADAGSDVGAVVVVDVNILNVDAVADVVADIVDDVGSVVGAVVVVLSKSCITLELFALIEKEISATDDFTIATKTFLFIKELDDPGGVCKKNAMTATSGT